MTISTIVLDLGNVLLTNDHPFHTVSELKEFSTYFDVTLDNLELGFDIAFPAFKIGEITEDEFWKKYLTTARAKKIDIVYAKRFFREHQKENEHMLSLVKALKKNYTLAALTTIPKEWLDFKKEKFHLDNYFKTIVSSGYSGFSKPDPRIYQSLIEQLCIPARKIIFIDDNENALLPPQKLGMQTILFRGQNDLENTLQKIGIL